MERTYQIILEQFEGFVSSQKAPYKHLWTACLYFPSVKQKTKKFPHKLPTLKPCEEGKAAKHQ